MRKGKIVIRAINKRLFDLDNLHGGTKPICDYFVQAGYFYDDSAEWLDREITQEKGTEIKTTIEIWFPPTEKENAKAK